ncbi:MAG: hypothetical protein IH609_04585 [Dehalococcoidia bacterium]|nr:hypothetical protein [Dehalococcoidia bacterium]
MPAYQPEDLTPIEVALLGVLSVGLPPSRAAGSDTFRVDHVTAVVHGLANSGEHQTHLGPDGVKIAPAFRDQLRAAIASLSEKGLVVAQAAGTPAASGGFEAGLQIDLVDPDEHPAVLDRYLSQLCMEQLFNIAAVYPYLIERYAASGEVWRRLREDGYARD